MQEGCSRKGMTQEMQNRRGETGEERLEWQRDGSQRGELELMELIFHSVAQLTRTASTLWHREKTSLSQGREAAGPGEWDRSPHCLPFSLLPQPVDGCSGRLCPALPCLALVHQGPPRVPGRTARSSGTPRSQPAFDASSCGTEKNLLAISKSTLNLSRCKLSQLLQKIPLVDLRISDH